MIKWFDTRGACFSSIAHMKHAHWLIFLGLVIAFVSVSNGNLNSNNEMINLYSLLNISIVYHFSK